MFSSDVAHRCLNDNELHAYLARVVCSILGLLSSYKFMHAMPAIACAVLSLVSLGHSAIMFVMLSHCTSTAANVSTCASGNFSFDVSDTLPRAILGFNIVFTLGNVALLCLLVVVRVSLRKSHDRESKMIHKQAYFQVCCCDCALCEHSSSCYGCTCCVCLLLCTVLKSKCECACVRRIIHKARVWGRFKA